jgi:hypothetical protein
LEAVLNHLARPLRIEKLLQGAGGMDHHKRALIHDIDEFAGHNQVLAWLREVPAVLESFAVWTSFHTQVWHDLGMHEDPDSRSTVS